MEAAPRMPFRPGRDPRRGGCLLRLLLLGAFAALLLALAWVVLLPGLLVSAIQARTGFAVQVEHLALNPLRGTVTVNGLVARNPADWPEAAFLDLRRFRAEVDLLPLLGGRFVADEVVLDIARLTLVRNAAGQLNAVVFKDRLTGPAAPAAPVSPPAASARVVGRDAGPFFIRKLELRFGQLVYADHSGRRPVVRTFDVDLRRDLRDVDSVTKIISPFTGAALEVLADATAGMFRTRKSVLEELQDLVQAAGRRTGETLKELLESLEKLKPRG